MLKCQDNFMIRTPSLPLEYLKRFENQKKDIYEFIIEDEYLYNFFKSALLVSSKTTYYSFINKPTDEKAYRDLKESLMKYFIRSIVRATPYGYMAGVSLGKFGKQTNLIRDGHVIDLQVDNAWLCAVIYNLESKKEILNNLEFKFNTICYVSKKRLVNPCFTNHGIANENNEKVKETSVRYTDLIRTIQELATNFISYKKLKDNIHCQYPEATEEMIDKSLHILIENEFILSVLRMPVYCEEYLEYVITTLKRLVPNCSELRCLEDIQKLITEYKKNKNIDCLEFLYKKMSHLHRSKNYIILNLGNIFSSNILSEKIKIKIEKVMNIFYKFPLQMDSTRKFKEKFIEEYGANVRVPLLEIIEKKGFNGTSLISMFEIKENILEKEVEEIIKQKIFLSILNDEEEVNFIEEDFIEILNDELQYPKDCDVNFIITKKYDGYQLYLSACGGSSRAGSMFQRFSKCFEKNSLHTYDQIYQEINNIYAAECALVEVREFSSDGRIRNVVNNIQKRPYYIAFGSTQEDSEKELYLKDISVGLTLDHRLFLYSETLKKRIRIVQDNMLNPQIENEIIKLLLTITEQEEYFPERRMINFLRKIEYNYIPRIKIEGVVISTRSWFLSKENLQCKNFQEFKRKFYDYKKKYKMDDICYYAKADNRVLLNLNDKEQLHILFKEHKKGIGLFFQELETNFDNISIISNQKNQSYLGEFVFSLVTSNVSYKNNSFLNNKNHVLDTKRRKNTLYEEGWIYFKLYVDRDKSNEILVDYLPNLIKDLNFPQHFFVRYSDSAGHHLRIRMNFSTSQCAIEKMPIILSWINLLMEKEMIKRVSFDTYVRENNRYGGNQLIELYEDVFFKDSILVEKILSHDSLLEEEMLEKWYIFGITHILMCLSEGPEDILKKLDTIANNKIYRNEYRKKCKNYISLINDILNKNFPLSKEIEREVKNIETALLLYKKQLQYFNKSNSLTNEINDIIFSIVHMHCNRLTGENLYERKYLEIVRNAMYHLIEVKKHYKM